MQLKLELNQRNVSSLLHTDQDLSRTKDIQQLARSFRNLLPSKIKKVKLLIPELINRNSITGNGLLANGTTLTPLTQAKV
jgi:hypothetical protein